MIFLVLSGLATGGSWLSYYRALKLGPASLVAPIDKMSVVLVAVFAILLVGERLTLLHGLGAALIAGGAILVAIWKAVAREPGCRSTARCPCCGPGSRSRRG